MNKPRILLLILAASFFFAGIAESPMAQTNAFTMVFLVHALFVSTMCVAWCIADATVRNIIAPRGTAPLAFLFPVIGIPLYFFRTRPWRAALIACVKTIAFFAFAIALLELGAFVRQFLAVAP